jgi:hypothetical protein
MKIRGGNDNVFKRGIEKLQTLKESIAQFRKPLEYIGAHPNEKYAQTCCKLIKNATDIQTIHDSSLCIFAKILGSSSFGSFISACKDLAYNAGTIAADFQTFTAQIIPKITQSITNRTFIEKYIRNNFNDIKYALKFTVEQKWVTSDTLKKLIEGMQNTDIDRFVDGIMAYLH